MMKLKRKSRKNEIHTKISKRNHSNKIEKVDRILKNDQLQNKGGQSNTIKRMMMFLFIKKKQ